jgi:HAD superfamily hydrolase (TIGR01458 family)
MTGRIRPEVKGILFDMDGVVHIGDSPIHGAAETLRHLKAIGIPYRFLTNTTTKTVETLSQKMAGMGLPIEVAEIFTTHQVAVNYLRARGSPPCFPVVASEALPLYDGFPRSESAPEYIILGDIEDRWSYALLNRLFNCIMDGATLLALHKGRYWRTEEGLRMDIGVFVAGLEYTTGKEAVVLGKPSPTFFRIVMDDLAVHPDHVIMVGDDVESDIGGAQKIGMRGVLVKTGKYREENVGRSGVRPDAIISSIAELKDLIKD